MDSLPLGPRAEILEMVFAPLITHSMGYLEQMYLWHCFWPAHQLEWRLIRGFGIMPSDPGIAHPADALVRTVHVYLREEREINLRRMVTLILVARDWYHTMAREVRGLRGRLLHPLAPVAFPLPCETGSARTLIQKCRGYEPVLDRCLTHLLRKVVRFRRAPWGEPTLFSIWAFSNRHSALEIPDYHIREGRLSTAPPPRLLWDIFVSQIAVVGDWPRSNLLLTPFRFHADGPTMEEDVIFAYALHRGGPIGKDMQGCLAVTMYQYGLTWTASAEVFGTALWRDEAMSRALFLQY